MNYWELNKTLITTAMQCGKITSLEGYPLQLIDSLGQSLKDYKIWGNEEGLSKSVTVTLSGKNFFDFEKAKTDFTPIHINPVFGENSFSLTPAGAGNYMGVLFNQKFYINGNVTISFNNTKGVNFVIRFFDESDKNISKDVSWGTYLETYEGRYIQKSSGKTIVTLNVPQKVRYFKLVFYPHGTSENTFSNLQVEMGKNATVFEPYVQPIETGINLEGYNAIMPNDYLDFRNACIMRSDGKSEDITLPKIPTLKGYNIITAQDEIANAGKIYVKYVKKV